MPKHNKKTIRRSRKKGRKNEKKTRKNIKKGGFLFGLDSKKERINKFTTTIDDKTLVRMKELIGLNNAKVIEDIHKNNEQVTFEQLAEKMNVSEIRITEYKYRNNLPKKDLFIGPSDIDAHYGMFQKVIEDKDIIKRIIAMFAIILNDKNLTGRFINKYNDIKYVLNKNDDKSRYWMVEYGPDSDNMHKQINPGEKITKKNIFMFQFADHGYIKNIPGFKFSILNKDETAFSREKSERPAGFENNWHAGLYTHPIAKIEKVKL